MAQTTSVHTNPAADPQLAERRLANARAALAAAERHEDAIERRIDRHGGISQVSEHTVAVLACAHEAVFRARVDVRRWTNRLADATEPNGDHGA